MSTIQDAVAEFGAFHVIVGPSSGAIHLVCAHALALGVASVSSPENGLYPSAIGAQVRRLRADYNSGRLIVHTNSPLVLNECDPTEASIVTRNAAGEVVVTRFDRTKDFARRSGAFALGELWLTFCDGDKEVQLVPE